MNSEQLNTKKISEYQIEDIKKLFVEVLKKISSKIILLEIGTDFINIALAKSQKNKLFIKKVLRQNLPSDALDKSIPSDPKSFGEFLKQIINENHHIPELFDQPVSINKNKKKKKKLSKCK